MSNNLASVLIEHNQPTPDDLVGSLIRERENSKHFSWKFKPFSRQKVPEWFEINY